MKKPLFILVILLVALTAATAASPDYFSFEIGAGAGWAPANTTIQNELSVGLSYAFSPSFSGGFNFLRLNNVSNFTMLNIGINPVDAVQTRLYFGLSGASVAFGLGVGYDFFSRNEGLFSSLGLFIDWIATVGAPFDVQTGGVFMLGLRTKVGA